MRARRACRENLGRRGCSETGPEAAKVDAILARKPANKVIRCRRWGAKTAKVTPLRIIPPPGGRSIRRQNGGGGGAGRRDVTRWTPRRGAAPACTPALHLLSRARRRRTPLGYAAARPPTAHADKVAWTTYLPRTRPACSSVLDWQQSSHSRSPARYGGAAASDESSRTRCAVPSCVDA